MIRKIAVCMLLLLAVSAGCLAEIGNPGDIGRVYNVNEYVTLREIPNRKGAQLDRIPLDAPVVYLGETDGDFSIVSYRGQWGYVLSEYLKRQAREKGTAITPDDAMSIRINLFLTAFSDICFEYTSAFLMDAYRDRELVDFAVDTLYAQGWDYGEWGKNNARIDGTTIPEIVERWFGVSSVDVTDTRYDYDAGYYYSDETGGRMTGGFVIHDKVEMLGADRCRVAFTVYGQGENWKPEAVCTLSPARAAAMYPESYKLSGEAIINLHGHPEDEQQWTLLYWFINHN